MSEQMSMAERTLKSALEGERLCTWPVNKRSKAYKLGLLLGVSLSWPGKPGEEEKIRKEIEVIKNKTEQVARESGLKANLEGPNTAAGGALVVYCGFETPFLITATQKAKDQNKPIWQVCEEDPELLELAK